MAGFFAGLATVGSTIGGGAIFGGLGNTFNIAGNYIFPTVQLPVNDIITLYNRSIIAAPDMGRMCRQQGFLVNQEDIAVNEVVIVRNDGVVTINNAYMLQPLTPNDHFIKNAINWPTNDEASVMFNRELINKYTFDYIVRMNTGRSPAWAQLYDNMRFQIPGPSDLVAFAVRDCFSPDIVSTFEYAKELPTAILPWMKKQGLGGDVGVRIPPNATTTEGRETRTDAKWFDLYWWSHWALPSVGQGYEMLQRLYPQSSFGPSPFADNTTYFSSDNLELLQKANDYPPFWRKRLQAIAYHPIGIRYIRQLYQYNIIKEDADNHDVYHAYRQLGYNDTDSQRLSALVVKTARKDILDLTMKQIERLYKQGTLGDSEAVDRIKQLTYPERDALYAVENWKLELAADEVDSAIKAVKTIYMKADINMDQVRSKLSTMRLSATAIARLLRMWNLELLAGTKHVTANEAVKWFKNNIIPESSLELRLTQLNYNAEERYGIIATAKDEMVLRDGKILDAMTKETQRTIAALARQREKNATDVAKEHTKELVARSKAAEKLSNADKKAYTEKNIIAFYKGGFIDESQVKNILDAKGWLPNTINVWMRQFTPSKK